MLEYRKSQRIESSDADLLVNTVNTVGVMGAGVALAMKKAFPQIMEPYKKACRENTLAPGTFQVLPLPSGQKVINLATKQDWRNPSEYRWVGAGLVYLNRYIMEKNRQATGSISSVLLPPPGCGHGGLEWSIVNQMIRNYLEPSLASGVKITVTMDEAKPDDAPVYYAGIGSRDTPGDALALMTSGSALLAARGYGLRSGAAKGADTAFESGADSAAGDKQIFRASDDIPDTHFRMARNFHPAPQHLHDYAVKLMARNTSQIFGVDFTTPSNLVICYTPGGKGGGGTGQALRMARSVGMPVIDLGDPAFKGLSAEGLAEMASEKIEERRQHVAPLSDILPDLEA